MDFAEIRSFPLSARADYTSLREYHIPDFSNWKNHDAFEVAFADLLRDLRAQE